MYACKFDSQGEVVKKIAHEVSKKQEVKKEKIHIQDLNVRKDNRITLSCPPVSLYERYPLINTPGINIS